MPALDIFKIVFMFLIIGCMAGGLMWVYNQFATPYNAIVAQGIVSSIGVQSMTIIYWSIVAYAPLCIIFSALNSIIVANARAETNSPYITTNYAGQIVLPIIIIISLVVDFLVCSFLDPFMIGMGGIAVPGASIDPNGIVAGVMASMFSAAHIGCDFCIAIAFMYMILTSIRVESLQWSV